MSQLDSFRPYAAFAGLVTIIGVSAGKNALDNHQSLISSKAELASAIKEVHRQLDDKPKLNGHKAQQLAQCSKAAQNEMHMRDMETFAPELGAFNSPIDSHAVMVINNTTACVKKLLK